MPAQSGANHEWTLASRELIDASADFILSRQAMGCSPATLSFYSYTAGAFLRWAEGRGLMTPAEVTARLVREYLAHLVGDLKADTTVHDHARAIKTLVRFWHAEGYLPEPVLFPMPKLHAKRLPMLEADELQKILTARLSPRDRALVFVMADSGLRRGEICALNWRDLDMNSGLLLVRSGKGGKARVAVIGVGARRALLAYRRRLPERPDDDSPIFLARSGRRLSGAGVLQMLRRLSERTKITVTAHALRRTFTTLSLRAGMNPLEVQRLLGHASLDMVQHYAQMIDEDLLEAHHAHSPIDELARLIK